MPTKGTPVRSVRIDDDVWTAMEFQLISLRTHSPKRKWNFGAFINAAIREKLEKMERSRSGVRRRPAHRHGDVFVPAICTL